MTRIKFWTGFLLRCVPILCALLLGPGAAEGQRRCVLQGENRLAIVSADNSIEWELPWGGIHDIHVLPNGNVMLQQGASNVVEIDRQTRNYNTS